MRVRSYCNSLCRDYVNPFLSNSPLSANRRMRIICGFAAVLFLLNVLYHFAFYAYVETYVWQCTSFGETVRPIARTQCLVSYATDPSHKTTLFDVAHRPSSSSQQQQSRQGKTQTQSHTQTQTQSSPSKAKRIGMLMLYKKSLGSWQEDLMQRVLKNRERYCARHGCTVITANHLLDRSRPAAWSKLKAAKHYLSQYDYLFYIDMDVVIMNMDVPLSAFVDLAPNHDFVMTEDWNGLNSGNWLVKNTPFAHWFLETAWNQTQLIARKSSEGIKHPFEYEQRAFHFMLDTKVWRERHLPKFRGDSKELWTHFYMLPQCAMNSYVLHPFAREGDRQVSHYVKGDFLVHFAGKKDKIKTDLIRHYLDLSEE